MRSGWLAPHHLAVEATSMQRALLPLYLAEGKLLIIASRHHIHCWILIKDIYKERHLVSQFPFISRSAFVKLQYAHCTLRELPSGSSYVNIPVHTSIC